MKILVDANVLLRLSNQQHPMSPATLSAVRWIVMNKHDPVIVPQVLYEYWAVATRPIENNGLGQSTAETNTAVLDWLGVFSLADDEGVFPLWHNLVSKYDVESEKVPGTISALLAHPDPLISLSFFRDFPLIETTGLRNRRGRGG